MNRYQNAVCLYDPEALLEVSPEVAQGYLILLSSSWNEDLTLPFASLTDGNVLDACFGCHPQRPNLQTPAWCACRDAKVALSSAALSGSAFIKLAIDTYTIAFTIVSQYHTEVHAMHCCFRCFLRGSKHRKAKHDLEQAFAILMEAVASAA